MKRILPILMGVIFSTCLKALEVGTDSLVLSRDSTVYRSIDEVTVVRDATQPLLMQRGQTFQMDMQSLKDMPQLGGTADPLRYLESLPGIATNNEMNTGIHIQGTDDYQTAITINKAPIYYPNHLLGLYSTFISDHFNDITLTQAAHNAAAPNRLGGNISFNTYNSPPQRWHLTGNVGIIHSDATFSTPIAKHSALFLSARASYINLLYKKLLNFDGYQALYGFQDANITFLSTPTKRDKIIFTGFFSHDKMSLDADLALVKIPWYNAAASLSYTHTDDWGEFATYLTTSGYKNTVNVGVNLDYADETVHAEVDAKTDIGTVALLNQLHYRLTDHLNLLAGIDYHLHTVQPMHLNAQHLSENFDVIAHYRTAGHEAAAYIGLEHQPVSFFHYEIGARASLFASGNQPATVHYGAIDPRVTLTFLPSPAHRITLHYGIYHQYLHKTGLLEGGLPTDFYLLASPTYRPQWAHSAEISYNASLFDGKYTIGLTAYYKQLYHVIESTGNIFSLMLNGFDYDNDIIQGNGRNYGATLLLRKNSGYVTGYISYSLGWAKRQFPQIEGREDYCYAAAHERRHDLSVVLQSKIGKRWSVGAMFTLASGLPFTRPEEIYIINRKVICRYGIHNGAQMPLYHRLDLSANFWIIKRKNCELGLNLSLYNVYNHRNAQYVVYRQNLGIIYGSSISRIIPSLALFFNF